LEIFGEAEAVEPESWIDLPSYVADTLRAIAGPSGRVVNATAVLMDASTGMRAINEVDQLAQFEFGAARASEAVKRVVFGLRPGMSEYEAVRLMQLAGIPLSAHLMLSPVRAPISASAARPTAPWRTASRSRLRSGSGAG